MCSVGFPSTTTKSANFPGARATTQISAMFAWRVVSSPVSVNTRRLLRTYFLEPRYSRSIQAIASSLQLGASPRFAGDRNPREGLARSRARCNRALCQVHSLATCGIDTNSSELKIGRTFGAWSSVGACKPSFQFGGAAPLWRYSRDFTNRVGCLFVIRNHQIGAY
jgi:hypothetical protein